MTKCKFSCIGYLTVYIGGNKPVSTIHIPSLKITRLSLLSLGLGLAGSQLLASSAQAGANTSFWRDLEAYAQTQRARLDRDNSETRLQPEQTACLYVRACLPDSLLNQAESPEGSLAHTEAYAASGYMYSHYTLPRRLPYVSFEETYYPSPNYGLSYGSYTLD